MLSNLPQGELILVGDRGGSSYRLTEQPYYKGQRRAKQTPEEAKRHELFSQEYQQCLLLAEIFNVKVVAPQGLEADDCASIIAERYKDHAIVHFLTNDRDWLYSILESKNVMYTLDGQVFTDEYARLEYNVRNRNEWLWLKAITGDTGDNLKGIVKWHGAAQVTRDIEEADGDLDKVLRKVQEALDKPGRTTLRQEHIDAGRNVQTAFISNMKIAEPFTDYTHLTSAQIEEFNTAMRTKPSACSETELYSKSIEALGAPLMLTAKAKEIYL